VPPRITPDSNILISALIFGGNPLRLLEMAAHWDVIPRLGAVQPSEESGAQCFISCGSLTLRARSLAPLVKARGFGMTSS
jgi:hypothetical protein